jgi:choline transport protein
MFALVEFDFRVLWTIFTTVFFCFPAVMPVQANNMNYISVILVGYILLAMVWWVIRGRKVFRGPQGGEDDRNESSHNGHFG